ncbi:hypothetical protein BCR33DRAFT_716149 [Rhizoclosmatium globosum]|uniref:Uncharacterized protein n=1 Tax=Rhizoclosmatium globosum TaxID=329046 RepID=A0A1Y2CEG4_9FUNG|nr:hypothetical protein BCR33DRAFT_716149 [Rhizoclosmatium globosum]|eukprot:ORY45458.1 hypothetical protein BCR33DRAFT_716149 [Rhizoclosmatium globosum]
MDSTNDPSLSHIDLVTWRHHILLVIQSHPLFIICPRFSIHTLTIYCDRCLSPDLPESYLVQSRLLAAVEHCVKSINDGTTLYLTTAWKSESSVLKWLWAVSRGSWSWKFLTVEMTSLWLKYELSEILEKHTEVIFVLEVYQDFELLPPTTNLRLLYILIGRLVKSFERRLYGRSLIIAPLRLISYKPCYFRHINPEVMTEIFRNVLANLEALSENPESTMTTSQTSCCFNFISLCLEFADPVRLQITQNTMFLELVYKWTVRNSCPSLKAVVLSSSVFLCRVVSANGGILHQMIEMSQLFNAVLAETATRDGKVIKWNDTALVVNTMRKFANYCMEDNQRMGVRMLNQRWNIQLLEVLLNVCNKCDESLVKATLALGLVVE